MGDYDVTNLVLLFTIIIQVLRMLSNVILIQIP